MSIIAEKVFEAVKTLPDQQAEEVLDFVEFLKAKRRSGEDETVYLLRDPANARDLLEAVQELKEGRGYQVRELLPDD